MPQSGDVPAVSAPAGLRLQAPTGETEYRELAGTSTSATRVAFLAQLRANHAEPFLIIWDNGPAHGGEAMRSDRATPGLNMPLSRLPADSPDFNADEALWAWVREEVTANTCRGTKAVVQEKVGQFFDGLESRREAVKTRCRTKLQALAAAADVAQDVLGSDHVVLTRASV